MRLAFLLLCSIQGASYFLRCTNEGVPLTSASTQEPLPGTVKELESLVSRHGADLTPLLPPSQALNNLPPLFVQVMPPPHLPT